MCCLPLSGALLLAPHPARSVVAGAVGLAVAVGSGAVLAVLLHRRQPE
jgi:hypothetical protein